MKKFIPLIGLICLLGCSNSEDLNKITQLESDNQAQLELLSSNNIEIKNLKGKISILESKNNELENQIELLESKNNELNINLEEKEKNDIFNKNKECANYGEAVKFNSTYMKVNDVTRFYSNQANTCIFTEEIWYKNGNTLYSIVDSISGDAIYSTMCPQLEECNIARSKFEQKILDLKNN